MYLATIKSKGETYLYKAEKIRVAKGKYKEQKTRIGKLSELEKIYDNPIQYFKNEIEEYNEKKEQQLTNSKVVLNLDSHAINTADICNGAHIDEKTSKNFGHIFLQHLYYMLGLDPLMLEIKRKLKQKRNNHKAKLKMIESEDISDEYKEILRKEIENDESVKVSTKIALSKVLQLLVYNRCLFPKSKLADFKTKDEFADDFNVSLDDIYRSLDIFNEYKDDIVSTINNNMNKIMEYDLSKAHYDLTNYYIYTSRDSFLIKNGYGKVNNNLPIIQMALLTDAKGLPINYKLFPGNRNDVSTMVEFLSDQKKRYNIRNSTYVADAGLISNDNIVGIILSGNHYILKARMLQLNKEIYNTFKEVVKPSIEEVMKKNPNLKGCYFPVNITTNLKVKNTKGGTENIEVIQKYIFMYSEKYDKRSEKIRMTEIENANKYIENPEKIANKFKNVASGLLKVDTKKATAALNEKKLNKYEETSGYSLLVTDLIDKNDSEIIEAYKNQYLIEESFRYSKTNLDIDNVYLQKENRIEAHFLTGFIALTLLRILQLKLNREVSIDDIQASLKKFYLNRLRGTNYYQTSTIDDVIAKLHQEFKLDINRTIYDGNVLRSSIANAKKH